MLFDVVVGIEANKGRNLGGGRSSSDALVHEAREKVGAVSTRFSRERAL